MADRNVTEIHRFAGATRSVESASFERRLGEVPDKAGDGDFNGKLHTMQALLPRLQDLANAPEHVQNVMYQEPQWQKLMDLFNDDQYWHDLHFQAAKHGDPTLSEKVRTYAEPIALSVIETQRKIDNGRVVHDGTGSTDGEDK